LLASLHEMADKPLTRPRVICALDFGTTFSGFAFAALAADGKIFQWCARACASVALPFGTCARVC
jgi:hypothetical protein